MTREKGGAGAGWGARAVSRVCPRHARKKMAPAGALTSRGARPSPLLSRLPSLLLAPQVLVRAGVDLDDLARADEEGDLLEGGEGGATG